MFASAGEERTGDLVIWVDGTGDLVVWRGRSATEATAEGSGAETQVLRHQRIRNQEVLVFSLEQFVLGNDHGASGQSSE